MIHALGDISSEGGVCDIPDGPFVDKASEGGGLPGTRRLGPFATADDSAHPVAATVQLSDDEATEVAGGSGNEGGGHESSLQVSVFRRMS